MKSSQTRARKSSNRDRMSSDKSSDIVDRAMESAKKEPKFEFKLSSRAFYSPQKVNRKLDFDEAADDHAEIPSTARMRLALEASLHLLAASEADNDASTKKASKKRSAKSIAMGLVGGSPRSPTLSKLQRRSMAMEAQFSVQGGSPFATPHYAQQSRDKAKRSRDQGVDEGEEEDEEGDLKDAIAKRGRGREGAGNLGTAGLLGSFYGPSSAGNELETSHLSLSHKHVSTSVVEELLTFDCFLRAMYRLRDSGE